MADVKLVGQNYTTPDLVAKVTGKAKYAEDYRVEGMLFAKLLVSPYPHARVLAGRSDTTRQLKLSCNDCGAVWRASAKWAMRMRVCPVCEHHSVVRPGE